MKSELEITDELKSEQDYRDKLWETYIREPNERNHLDLCESEQKIWTLEWVLGLEKFYENE